MEEERYHEVRPYSWWASLKCTAHLVGTAVIDIIKHPELLKQVNWFENRWK